MLNNNNQQQLSTSSPPPPAGVCPFHHQQQTEINSQQQPHETKKCPHASSSPSSPSSSSNCVINSESGESSMSNENVHAMHVAEPSESQPKKCPFHHSSSSDSATPSSSASSSHALSTTTSRPKPSLLSKTRLKIPMNLDKKLQSIKERPVVVEITRPPTSNSIMDHSMLNSNTPPGDICYFFESAINGDLEKMKELVEVKNFNVNTIDKFGYDCSALQFAVNGGKFEIVKYLISKNANVNLVDVSGEVALHKACKKGNFEMVKALLKAGAVKNHVNKFGKLPIDICNELGFSQLSQYLSQFDYPLYIARKKTNKYFKDNLKRIISPRVLESSSSGLSDCFITHSVVQQMLKVGGGVCPFSSHQRSSITNPPGMSSTSGTAANSSSILCKAPPPTIESPSLSLHDSTTIGSASSSMRGVCPFHHLISTNTNSSTNSNIVNSAANSSSANNNPTSVNNSNSTESPSKKQKFQ